mmetsp:Transcript_36209/g.56552  ORF Transcript_36209/g.56552 Transcript_36209/m.56552 type:complete len:80 (-) Transcript_36209:237-476(-)
MIKQHTEVHKVLQCWKHMGLLQDGKWHSPLSQQDSEEIRGILTVSIEGQISCPGPMEMFPMILPLPLPLADVGNSIQTI